MGDFFDCILEFLSSLMLFVDSIVYPLCIWHLHVARLLLQMSSDQDALVAALLHDTIEDTPFSIEQVTYQYGRAVACIVQKVTNLTSFVKKTQCTPAYVKEQLASYHDPRVVMVKLADRLHNLQTLQYHSPAKQQQIREETLHFYIPLGKSLKLPLVDQFVLQLEKMCHGSSR